MRVLPQKLMHFQHEFSDKNWNTINERNSPRMCLSPEDILISIEDKAEIRYEQDGSVKDKQTYIRLFRNRIVERM